MKSLWFALSVFGFAGHAALAQVSNTAPVTKKAVEGTTLPNEVPGEPVATSANEPNPWKLVYMGEYVGPRLQNIKLDETQGASDADPGYAEWVHRVKLGHTLFTPNFVVGVDVRAEQLFDPNPQLATPPTPGFFFDDFRVYFSLSNMVDNDYLNIQQILDLEFPTSTASQNINQVFRANIKDNFTFKTPLRNIYFSALTYISPRWFSTPNPNKPQTDLYLAIDPEIDIDLTSTVQLKLEGEFDMAHTVVEPNFDFNSSYDDYIDIGPSWSPNAHLNFYPAVRMFTGNFSFKASELYLYVTVAL